MKAAARLASGETIARGAWRAPKVNTIVVASDEVYHMIDPLHITRFELMKSNGHRKISRKRK